ncbi:MAG: IclR family transcriptional regulator [Burkholderiaceae bacterium]
MDKTLLKGLALLELLARDPRDHALGALVETTGLQKSNVHRTLTTLIEAGYVRPGALRGTYRASLKVWDLGCAVVSRLDVRSLALKEMQALSLETGESIILGVLDGTDVAYVERCLPRSPLAINLRVGDRSPSHTTAMGKVLLAFGPAARVDELPAQLSRHSRTTITTRQRLKDQLEQIRRDGYAVSRGELVLEVGGIAAPIFDRHGEICAALSISSPMTRQERQEKRYTRLVVEAAQRVSHVIRGA